MDQNVHYFLFFNTHCGSHNYESYDTYAPVHTHTHTHMCFYRYNEIFQEPDYKTYRANILAKKKRL